MISSKIIKRIRAERIALGISQESFAKKIGISKAAYADIERGKTRLFHPKLEAIAESLNLSFVELLLEGRIAEEYPYKEERDKEAKALVRELQEEIALASIYSAIEGEELKAKLEMLSSIIDKEDEEKGREEEY